jgi:hypothetical protein
MSDLREYLDACYGEGEGTAFMALGTDPYLTETGKYEHRHRDETAFAWPAEADRLEREIAQSAHLGDVYVCPYLMLGDKRHKSSFVELKLIHADIDNGALDLDEVRAIPGAFCVGSGSPGNGHVYVALDRPVTLAQHRQLCTALRDHLGGTDSKIVPSDLLRPPCTYNYKPTIAGGERAEVAW